MSGLTKTKKMSNAYYYLVASLPHLAFGDAPPISRERFLEECAKWLTPSDLARLSKEALEGWKEFDLGFRGEIKEAREAQSKNILGETNPLFMEKRFEEARWNFLEDKELGHHFDLEILTIYLLKLRILERLAGFDTEKGKVVFESIG